MIVEIQTKGHPRTRRIYQPLKATLMMSADRSSAYLAGESNAEDSGESGAGRD